MNQIIIFNKDFINHSTVKLQGRRKDHIISILKSKTGDTVRVGLLNGKKGKGTVTGINDLEITLDLDLIENPPPPLSAVLILSLPRPKILKRVLQCASAMGVKRIALIRTWKVDKSYWQSPVLLKKNLEEELILGLEQACDTVMPEVSIHKLFRPFVEDELEGLSAGSRCLVAHPGSKTSCMSGISEKVTLAIGPEAGFIPYEIEMLEKKGFQAVSVGERILRVDQAVPAILGRLFS
jgi:16S rRNA (uracil1498-N3)-methyltransferase